MTNYYARNVPQSVHGTINIEVYTFSNELITDIVRKLYGRIVDDNPGDIMYTLELQKMGKRSNDRLLYR